MRGPRIRAYQYVSGLEQGQELFQVGFADQVDQVRTTKLADIFSILDFQC